MKRRLLWYPMIGIATGVTFLVAIRSSYGLIQEDLAQIVWGTNVTTSSSPSQKPRQTTEPALTTIYYSNSMTPAPGVTTVNSVPGLPTLPVNPPALFYPTSIAGLLNKGVQVYSSPGAHHDDQKISSLLSEYQSVKEENKRSELVNQITATVTHQFEEKQQMREQELRQLEERLADLKQRHSKRESLKEKIVGDRVQQLLNNIEGLGWSTDPSPSGAVNYDPAMVPSPNWMGSPMIAPAASSPIYAAPAYNAQSPLIPLPLVQPPTNALPAHAEYPRSEAKTEEKK